MLAVDQQASVVLFLSPVVLCQISRTFLEDRSEQPILTLKGLKHVIIVTTGNSSSAIPIASSGDILGTNIVYCLLTLDRMRAGTVEA